MIYKRFKIICSLRILVLCISVFALIQLYYSTNLYASMFIAAVLIIYQVYSLVEYVDKTNKDLARFLLAIKHSDFSQTFSTQGLGKSFDSLKDAFMEVTDEFRKTRTEKEEHFRYLQNIVKHVGVGLMAYTLDGKIQLINNPAKRLLKNPNIKFLQSLESFSPELMHTLMDIKAGKKALIKIEKDGEFLNIATYASKFKLREVEYTLVSLQDINPELEEKEMEAWQNLIRVLTHEIMNSITPIASLASTANEIINDPGKDSQYDEESINDVRNALMTIERRSSSLLNFVDAYRNLTKIPIPEFQVFPVKDLFHRIYQLMNRKFEDNNIEFITSVYPESLELTADPDQVEQILINLIINAEEALKGIKDPVLKLTAGLNEYDRVVLKVHDNGHGILEDVQKKMFIPFFTTKQNGSGIGLSLSRQIMRLHKGTISVKSDPETETLFTLRF